MEADSSEYQYVVGQLRPTFPALLSDYEAASAEALTAGNWNIDVRYGPHPRQTFDLCHADGPACATILYFHPGYWQSRDKAQFRFLAPALSEAGFNLALANYPLCPDVQLAEIVQAVRQSVPALLSALPADQGRLPLIAAGHSAGGHLAVELALAQDTEPPLAVDAVVSISGVFDLTPLLSTSLNAKLQLDPAQALEHTPLQRVRAGLPPAVFVVGGEETPAFRQQSRTMAEAWSRAGNPGHYLELPEEDHFSILQSLRKPDGQLVGAFQRVLEGERPGR